MLYDIIKLVISIEFIIKVKTHVVFNHVQYKAKISHEKKNDKKRFSTDCISYPLLVV